MKKRRPNYKRRNYTRKRFSFKDVDPTVIIVISCVLATLIFSIILGNILGKKAQDSKNEQFGQAGDVNYQTSLPAPDKQNVRIPTINAFSVDMTGAAEGVSLSEQTGNARESGNALFVPIKTQNGNIIYSSEVTDELDLPANTNLTLSRLYQHFQYYDDYVCGYFKSDFNPYNSTVDIINTRAAELTLLAEAQENGFGELIIEFKSALKYENLVNFYSYLLDIKLALTNTPIGICLSKDFCESPDSSALISQIMAVADFFVVDLSGVTSQQELDATLASLTYLSTRYPCRIILSYQNQEAFDQTLALLDEHSITSFIVK